MMKENRTSLILFIIIILIGINLVYFSQKKKERLIEQNKAIGVAKIYKISRTRNCNNAYFVYFYNNNRFVNNEFLDSSGDEFLNKFYTIEFSSKQPKYSNIFLNKEVKDSIEITKAGFKNVNLD